MRFRALAAVAALCLLGGPFQVGAEAREPRGPRDLVRAYPTVVDRIEGGRLYLKDGRSYALSDGIAGKSQAARVDRPDIDDMFVEPYVPGPLAGVPTGEPGRARHEWLFTALYGDCLKHEVKLRRVAWMPKRKGGSVMFAEANGAADALERVVADLEKLPLSMTRYLVPAAGTYNCRKIKGTNRRSMHAYAAAIDINTTYSDYWEWSGGENARYRNRIPFEIVAIFERHGFVWGGKWKHFDTMHFEYRPELLPPRR